MTAETAALARRAPASVWDAHLSLRYRDAGERTLVASEHRGPLRVQKAFHPEGAPCHSILLHPPGGIAGGDALHIEVEVGARAHAVMTTPGATKWYKAPDRGSTQDVRIVVAAGGMAEWLPQENIVFDRARAGLSFAVDLAAGARYFGWEVFCLGRTAAGERFAQGALSIDTSVVHAGDLVFAERTRLDAGSALVSAPIGLGGAHVFATVVAAGTMPSATMLEQCRAIDVPPDARVGTSAFDGLVVGRFLGTSPAAARAWCLGLWRILRPVLCGRPAHSPRIWAT